MNQEYFLYNINAIFNFDPYGQKLGQTVLIIHCAKKIYYDKINQDISYKKWWNICKRLCGNLDINSIAALVENEVTVIDPLEKAEIFNDYFVGQSKLPSHGHAPPLLQPYQTVSSLSNILTTNDSRPASQGGKKCL